MEGQQESSEQLAASEAKYKRQMETEVCAFVRPLLAVLLLNECPLEPSTIGCVWQGIRVLVPERPDA